MKIHLLALLLLAPALAKPQSFIQRVYHPTHGLDLIACAQNKGINCFAGSEDFSSNAMGKIYAFDSTGNLAFHSTHYNPNHRIYNTTMCAGPGSGFTCAAYMLLTPSGSFVPLLTEIDSSGSLVSSVKVITANGFSATPTGLVSLPDSSLLVSLSHGSDLYLLQLFQGAIQKQFHITNDSLTGPAYESGLKLKRSTTGDIYIMGRATTGSISHNSFVHKLDSSLHHVWTAIVSDTNIRFVDLEIHASGHLLIAGEYRNNSGAWIPALVEMDTTGTVTWTKYYTAALTDHYVVALATAPNGTSDIIGIESLPSPGFDKITRIHVDSLGQVVFGTLINSSAYPGSPFRAEYGPDGSLLITARAYNYAMAMKLNADSMTTCLSVPFSFVATPYNLSSGYYIPAIDTPAFQTVSQSLQVSGTINTQMLCFSTGIKEPVTNTMIHYANPVTHRITLENIEAFERIAVFDITGRCMITQDIRDSSTWQHDVQDWPKGLYLIKMDGDKSRTIKVVKQ